MTVTAPAAGPAGRWRAVLCLLGIGVVPGAAQADLWSFENSVQTRFELNDNVSLIRNSPGTVNTLSISNTLNASRQLENSATRLNTAFSALRQRGSGASDRIDGQIALIQSYSDDLNSLSATAQYAQDFNNVVQNADVTVGRGERRATSLTGSWARALSERSSTSLQVSASQTGYGQQVSGAVDFSTTGVGVGYAYRLTETDTVTVQLSRSDYRVADSPNRALTHDVSIGMSRVLSDQVSASLSLGVYRTESTLAGFRIACPLQTSLCNAGLVPFIRVRETEGSADIGLQYNSTYKYQFDERSSFSFATGTQQTPTGSGSVTRGQTLNLGLTHAFSETVNASLGFAMSRSKFQGSVQDGTATQRSFAASITRLLSPELSLQGSFQWTEANNVGARNSASAHSVGISLKYDWSRIDLTR